MSLIYRQGELCEVWSNGASTWIPNAKVLEAPQVDCIIDGYSIRKGAVKVCYGPNEKWIMPADVPKVLRRPAAAAAPVPSSPGPVAGGVCEVTTPDSRMTGALSGISGGRSRDSELMCKNGCGRPVQPGLTRGLKSYDTCCKSCASNPGAGKHDANCGGVRSSPIGGDGPRSHGENPIIWLGNMLESPDKFDRHVQALWFSAFGGEATNVSIRRAWQIIEGQLMVPICEKLYVSKDERQADMKAVDPSLGTPTKSSSGGYSGLGGLTQLFGGATAASKAFISEDENIEVEAFTKLCRYVLKQKYEWWFPEKLPTKTRSFVRKNPVAVEDVYQFQDKLGEGSFGIVHQVVHKISKEKRVCKRIAKLSGKSGMKIEEILMEIESMASLDHPNVIKVYEYFEDTDTICQIMEPCWGGELQDRIDAVFRKKTSPMYSESFMNDVIKQTLRALAFMHSERFLHKDLKPQNIMLVHKPIDGATSASIKVIDFGLAELFKKDQKHSDQFGGTLLYMAPEVFRLELTMKSDIWSVGVILYNLITGDYPFIAQWPVPKGKDVEWWQSETSRLIQDTKTTFKPNPKLSTVSRECQDFLTSIFQKDPRYRQDAPGCLTHVWFKKFEEAPPPLSIGVIQCLEAYSCQPELKKALFLLIAHQSTAPALQELRSIFTHFDEANRGALSNDILREVLRRSDLSSVSVERILYALDRDDSGHVQWTEFIAAALCVSVCRNAPLVHAAFNVFDVNSDGKASPEDILAVFACQDCGKDKWARSILSETARLQARGGPNGPFQKDHFEKYIGSPMYTSAGHALRAVG